MDYIPTRMLQTDLTIATYKRRWRKHREKFVQTQDAKLLDVEILPLLDRVNKLRGVASVFSCSGHMTEIEGKKMYSNFYVSCVANREGLLNLTQFVDGLNAVMARSKFRLKEQCRFVMELQFGRVSFSFFHDWESYKQDILLLVNR